MPRRLQARPTNLRLGVPFGHFETSSVAWAGAGDLFAAGFLYGLMRDYPLQRCAQVCAPPVVVQNFVRLLFDRLKPNRKAKGQNKGDKHGRAAPAVGVAVRGPWLYH